METARVKIGSGAVISMDNLKDPARRQLFEAIAQLQGLAPNSWPTDLVVRLSGPEPLYLLKFTPDLRAFIQPTDSGEIEILDLAHRKTLEMFRSQKPNGNAKE